MKKIISFIVLCVFLLAVAASANNVYKTYTANEAEYSVYLDGKKITFEKPIVSINGSTYMPIREFCELNGYEVDWNEENRSANLTSPIIPLLGYEKPQLHYKTNYVNDGVIPNEGIAIEIGKILLKEYAGANYSHESKTPHIEYYYVADYIEDMDAWRVQRSYKRIMEGGKQGIESGIINVPTIVLSRSSGRVIYISTLSDV